MRCSECGSENVEGARFCSFCSKPLPQMVLCPSCRGEVLEGSVFCPMCAYRLDQGQTPGRAREGPLYAKTPGPGPARPPAHGLPDAVEPTEQKSTDTGSTLFCSVCSEPTSSDQLTFDLDGNRVCKRCMESGGKKKSHRTRAIELMKAEIEGKTTYVDKRNVSKLGSVRPRKSLETEQPTGSKAGLVVALLLFLVLVAGGGAGAYYFLVYVKQGGPGPSTPKPAVVKPPGDKGKGPATPVSMEPRWFTGTYMGLVPEGEEEPLSGALIFRSAEEETVYLVLPPKMQDTAKIYILDQKYKFKFKPDAEFVRTQRLTLSMLKGRIQELD